jgi:hypothetical protein
MIVLIGHSRAMLYTNILCYWRYFVCSGPWDQASVTPYYAAKEDADFKDFYLVFVFRRWCINSTTFA